jgi:hypothetical protein
MRLPSSWVAAARPVSVKPRSVQPPPCAHRLRKAMIRIAAHYKSRSPPDGSIIAIRNRCRTPPARVASDCLAWSVAKARSCLARRDRQRPARWRLKQAA